MPKNVADKLKEKLKDKGSVDSGVEKMLKNDFKDAPGIGFSAADMLAMFSAPKQDIPSLIPHMRKLYSALGKIIEDYEKEHSGDNSGAGGE